MRIRTSALLPLCAVLTALVRPVAAATAPPAGYWLGDANAPVPAAIRGGRVIHVQALEALLHRGDTVVVDVSSAPARPQSLAPGAPWMPSAHRAVPRAVWIPGAGAGVPPPQVESLFRRLLREATLGDLDAPVVVYCHARCWLSWNASKRAIGYGYRRVRWFPDGIEGWTAAGEPTVVAQPQTPLGLSASAPVGAPEAAPPPTSAPPSAPKLMVLDLELTGDLGGEDFTAEHAARLAKESARLRDDLKLTGMYRIMDTAPVQGALDRLRSQQAYLHDCNGCDLDVGRQLGADLVFVAWVDRVSGLILSLTYEIHDVMTGQLAARKSFDFRGDNDVAWNHAIDYMIRDLKAESSGG